MKSRIKSYNILHNKLKKSSDEVFIDIFINLLKIYGTPIGVPFTLHPNKKFINVVY
jgi:hypothetical protein